MNPPPRRLGFRGGIFDEVFEGEVGEIEHWGSPNGYDRLEVELTEAGEVDWSELQSLIVGREVFVRAKRQRCEV